VLRVANAWLSNSAWVGAVQIVQRLKTRPQFQAALAGKLGVRTTHFALHSCELAQIYPVKMPDPASGDALIESLVAPAPALLGALGAMVPKRWAKRAVTRNAIKRQIYSVSAQFAPQLRPRGHVVRLRAGFDRKEFISASSDLLKAAVRAELLDLFARASAHPQLGLGRA
jgi:ribonuclease P protein component